MTYRKSRLALYYSDEVLAMKDGKLVAGGAPEDVITEELMQEIYDVPLPLRQIDGKPFIMTV